MKSLKIEACSEEILKTLSLVFSCIMSLLTNAILATEAEKEVEIYEAQCGNLSDSYCELCFPIDSYCYDSADKPYIFWL